MNKEASKEYTSGSTQTKNLIYKEDMHPDGGGSALGCDPSSAPVPNIDRSSDRRSCMNDVVTRDFIRFLNTMRSVGVLTLLHFAVWWKHAHSFSVEVARRSLSLPISVEQAKDMQKQCEKKAKERHNNHAFNCLFEPVEEHPVPISCSAPSDVTTLYGPQCQTRIPFDFPSGALLRIGPNSMVTGDAFLDGDGMIHCITFEPEGDRPLYTSTYLETEGRKREAEFATESDSPRYRGSLGAAPQGLPILGVLVENAIKFRTMKVQKDTCNTAFAESGGRLLALMEQCLPTEFKVFRDGSIRTVQSANNLNGGIPNDNFLTGGALSAHGRTCPVNGDRIHVNYNSVSPPNVRVDIFEEGWRLKRQIPVDTPLCTMMHDAAISENYVVVMDMPLTFRQSRIFLQNEFPIQYEPEHGARIGLVPRHTEGEVQWFSVKPGVVLHMINAFEKDGKVIVQGCRSEPDSEASYIMSYAATFLYEWELDLQTGEAREECLQPASLVDFPVIDEKFNGQEADHVYCTSVYSIGGPIHKYSNPVQGILLDGITKHSLRESDDGASKGDEVGKFILPDGWFSVSEATIVPKEGKEGDYVLMIATNVSPDSERPLTSHVLILDGDNLDRGPVAAFNLPFFVPYGLHSHFVEWSKMA